VTHLVGPRPLPRLELAGGVPSDLRTLVVVPTLLADDADIEAPVSLLEVQYLANAEGDLRFALLTDWLDAPYERGPGDEALLDRALEPSRVGRRSPPTCSSPTTVPRCGGPKPTTTCADVDDPPFSIALAPSAPYLRPYEMRHAVVPEEARHVARRRAWAEDRPGTGTRRQDGTLRTPASDARADA